MPVDPPTGPLAGGPPVPGVVKPDPILTDDGVEKSFGGLRAVVVERLQFQRGVITGLIGPNGAGKTTLFNVLTGFDQPDSGRWAFDGKTLEQVRAHEMAERGMVRTFQLTKALSRLSVIENMKLGARDQRGEGFFHALWRPSWRDDEQRIEARSDDLLQQFNLAHMRDEYAGTMSGGQRRLLEMARALMAEPKLLMLDEPMAGVNPALRQSLLGHITKLRDEGRSVIFIEHDMDVVMGISDWVVVLAEGTVIAEGPPESILSNQEVIDAYLGAPVGDRP